MILFSQLKLITGGAYVSFHSDLFIETLCIDSRKATPSDDLLFFAIHGDRHDGHSYLQSLYDMGVRQFVVERDVTHAAMKEANILRVSSSVDALQQLCAFHRSQFQMPVIGITGSNGKTVVKEWLYQMLADDQVVVKNPGSYNSQVGVPLSIWQMKHHHQVGIFEAGISKPGEMEKLEAVIQPTLGVFTNVGTAHDEGFKNSLEKISEKLRLFNRVDKLICCRDHDEVYAQAVSSGITCFTWGHSGQSDVQVSFNGHVCRIQYEGNAIDVLLPFTDRASRENAMHCISVLLAMGYDFIVINERVSLLKSIPMRMELKASINDCQVVDDTYNNDLGGLELALHFLTNQHQKKTKRVILSDILESGLDEESLVEKISVSLKKYSIDKFIGIGPALVRFPHLFTDSAKFYKTTEEFLQKFDFDQLKNEIILVKGARKFAFERIVARLQRKVHGTIMEIDLNALVDNFNYFKSKLKSSTKIMVMVKAFAYGSGSIEIANLLQYHKADYLGVAYTDEGVELRKNNIQLPIMVMNPTVESFESLIAYTLEPEIYSLAIFKSLLSYLQGRPCTIHIKIDTGMHRLGLDLASLPELIGLIEKNSFVRVGSVFSHLAGADEDKHDDFSQHQYDLLLQATDRISEKLGYRPTCHILNTPGILRLPQFQLDMVRLGIGLYGIDPTQKKEHTLKPVATLKTIVSQIKHIRKGDSIGYGRAGLADQDITTATIAIGYADGFSRAFSRGVGEVLINGKKAKVVGNVCMDMTMVDVTGIDVNEGDEVVIFGAEFPIQDAAERIHTIPYEILTSTSERVKRVFVSDGI